MAEPDWTLLFANIQKIQDDIAELKAAAKEQARELTAISKAQDGLHDEITYTLGSMVALGRNMKTAQQRVDEIADRLEKLEAK